jgi:putative Holliday junction resolvase
MTRILGIDLGERRIGLAIGEVDTGAAPLATIRRSRAVEGDVDTIARVLAEQAATELVVGLPLEASGDEGPQAQVTRAWAEDVAGRLGVPLAFRDERLSSHLAEQRIGPMKRGRAGGPPTPVQRDAYRARIDREAAAIILQHELESRAAAGARTDAPETGAPATDSRATETTT